MSNDPKNSPDGSKLPRPNVAELADGNLSNVTGGDSKDPAPAETVSLTYGKIKWTYTEQKP